MTSQETPEQIAVKYAICPYCKAQPGVRCRTVKPVDKGVMTLHKGQRAATHASRMTGIINAYGIGYTQGLADGKRMQ